MPDRLEETVADFIRRHTMFAGAQRILLAVSGGADSIALLHLLVALRRQGRIESDLICAHVNHRLRGAASAADEQFVAEQARRLGLRVIARTVDVRAYALAHKLSVETAARELRLATLGEIARDQGCACVCTGHQKNDLVETILHRLRRGTGFRGLAGIRPVRQLDGLRVASPLLCATRREIVQYLDRHDLHWREDQTNVDIAYTRNFIRHRLLPFLQREARGDLVEELSALAASAQTLYARIEREAEQAWSRLVRTETGATVIEASGLACLPEPVAVELIRRAVASLAAGGSGLAEPHYRSILELAQRKVGGKSRSLPGGLLVRYERGHLTLRKDREREVGCVPCTAPARGRVVRDTHPTTPTVLAIPGRTQYAGHEIKARILPRDEVDATRLSRCARNDMLKGDKGRFVEYFDLDQVKPPVAVRARQAGDRFQPLGMSGDQKVGKFLTTAKVPEDVREQILIVADRERILWVCPVRISEPVKVTESTQRVLQVTVRNL